MSRLRLDLSYDGTAFSGWAKQAGGRRTVQGDIEDALRTVTRSGETYELTVAEDKRAFVYDFGIVVPGGRAEVEKRWDTAARNQFMEAFAASYGGRSEPDRFNALVMGADLGWREVGILRAIGRYLRQTGSTYSQTYVAQALTANVEIARLLVALWVKRKRPRELHI